MIDLHFVYYGAVPLKGGFA